MIDLIYFASIRERLNCDRERVELPLPATVADLLALLRSRGAPWGDVLDGPTLLVAVNQEMSSLETELGDGDEVAFFPPVTGG